MIAARAPRQPRPAAAVDRMVLRLHGDAAVLHADQAPLPLRGRAAGLVALAALEPGIGRARAAALLWPDAPNPRQNLRQQLLRFRQALGAPLIEGEQHLRLAAGVLLEPAPVGAELLCDEPAGDDEFGHWLSQQRQAMRLRLLQPLWQALAQAEASGDLDAALEQAQALLALDPLDERQHITLMRLHYLRGEAAAGLRAYDRLREMLSGRFATQPSMAAAQLADTLRQASASRALGAPAPAVGPRHPPLTLKRPPLLVGREAERAAVWQAWAQGQAVWLEGDAGIGKSRLMAELMAAGPVQAQPGAAAAEAQVTLNACGRPGDSGVPYATLVRLLQPLFPASAALDKGARQALSLLALAPAVAPGEADVTLANHTPAAVPVRLPPDAMPRAVAALLQHGQVQTIALDDLHFSDDATLELLAGLVAAPDTPWRWLFAARPAEGSPAQQALREGLDELQRLQLVRLAPLPAPAIATLIDTLSIPGLHGDTLAPALLRHSGGNPLFLLETLRLGLSDGSLLAGRLPRPEAVGSLIERRLRQLSTRALSLARVAAVAGVDFKVEVAEHTLNVPAVELSDAWSELHSALVLRDNNFAHDLVLDAVQRSIPAPIAAHLHGQVAAWLARRQHEPARVAMHWQAAGEERRAAEAWLEAAQVADRRQRFRESMACLDQAAALFGAQGDAPARYRALQEAIEQASMLELAVEDYALRVDALLDSAPDAATRAAAQVYRLRIHELRGDHAALVREAQTVIELAQSHGLQREEAIGLLARGTARGNQQQLDDALSDFARLATLGAEMADLEMQGVGHAAQATMMIRLGRSQEALAQLDTAHGLHSRAGHTLRLALVDQQRSVVLLGAGRSAAALEAADRALRGAQRADSTLDVLAHCWLARAMALRQLGRLSESLRALEPQLASLDDQGLWVADRARLELAQTYLYLGRNDLAQRLLAQARAPARMAPGETQRALFIELQLRALGGPLAAMQPPLPAPPVEGEPRRRCELLRALVALRPPSERAHLLDEALRTAKQFELHDERVSAQVLMAQHLLDAGQTHAAAELMRLAQADTLITPAGYPPAVAAAAHAVFSASGDHEAAQAALAQALQWIERANQALAPEFSSSFRERNPVNRALLALAARA